VDAKKITPAVTSLALGAVWLFMTSRHIPPPQSLNQALIAAIGATFASGAIPKKETPSEA
jgi:hypothetical protein